MAESVGQIGLDLVVNQKGFNKQMKGIGSLAKKAGAALAAAFAVKKIVDFGKSALEMGSQLAEVDNVIQQAVPSMEKRIDSFAKNAIQQFGMSEIAAKRYTGVFSSMARGYGFTEKSAASMGVTLTSLAADVASFYDTSQDEAFTKLKSIFTGETESLKSLGVVMTQSALDAYAMANGYGKATKNMTEAEKVALRYAFVQEKLRFAQDDFAKNSNSWANQVRILKEQFNALKASIGQGLINAFLPVLNVMNTLLAKIRTVANAFNALTEKVFGKADTSSQAVTSSVEGIGDASAEAVDGVGKAADATSKAAKKAKQGATSIDELNIVSPDSNSKAGAGSLDGAIAGLDDIKSKTEENIETPMSRALDNIKKIVGEIKAQFESGFMERFAKIDFTPVQSSLSGIKTSLQTLFSDQDVGAAASGFVSAFAYSLGAGTADFISVGTNIASNITQGINSSLNENGSFIKERLISIFDSGVSFLGTVDKLNDFLADVSTILTGPTAVGITSNIISMFTDGFLGVADLAARFGADFADMVVTPIVNNKDKIKTAIENTLKPIEKITGSIKDYVKNTFESIFDAYDKYIKPTFENLKSGFSTIFGAILDAYNNYLAPVIDNIADRFSWLMSDIVQPLVDAIIGLTGRIIEAISIVWEYISPFVGWIAEVLIAGLSNAFQTLWAIFEYIFSLIANAVTTIINVFSGLIDFVIGIFTGDWDRAWSGIKKIFTSIWDGIKTSVQIAINFISNIITTVLNKIKTTVTTILDGIKLVFTKIFDAIKARVELVIGLIKSIVLGVMTIMHDGIDGTLNKIKKVFVNIFTSIKNSVTDLFTKLWSNIKGTINSILGGIEGMANGVVRGVNRVIGALNNLSFDIPDWIPGLGGKTFGFSIPTLSEINIPKLAQGGFVKANTPQLAMIGDNRHQGEVVAPEDKLLEMALKAAKLASQGDQNSQTAELLAVAIELLKQILNALFGLNLSAEVDGRTLLTILTNEQNRSGFDLIT